MTKNQLKSKALLVIAALVVGTIISTGANLLLTSRETGDEAASQSKAAGTGVESSADSLAGQETSTDDTGEVAQDADSASELSESVESVTDETPDDSTDSNEPQVVTYEEKTKSLFAKLDELKSKRQAIRDRIRFDAAEF